MITPLTVWQDIEAIRRSAPLVHNITNYVAMNSTANALLAIGASPVMAHAPEEMEEMVAIASALVINIGTLSQHWIDSMHRAACAAGKRRLPVVLDPVGAGASTIRTQTARELLQTKTVTILRGNAAEIAALCDDDAKTKGVDSEIASELVVENARAIHRQYRCVVVVSGETDYVIGRESTAAVRNGHPMMTRVTGLGCTASALTGAFAAVNEDAFAAAAHAMVVLGICGDIAEETSQGPGSLQVNILDALYALSEDDLAERATLEIS